MADEESISAPIAAVACVAMSVLYVVILYAPTVLLRLPQSSSVKDFLLRRFVCAIISSLLSLYLSSLIISMRNMELSDLLRVYGVRSDHTWEAVLIPLSLTCLMYSGSLVLKSLLLVDSCSQYIESSGGFSFECVKYGFWSFIEQAISLASNIYSWRAFVVAPLTEEIVFRACMIPLLLCGGFKTNTVIFLCPVFFSLAHLNRLREVYTKENYNLAKALVVVGIQLSYTLVFGSYASFLFIRTGHLLAPLVAHICCNFMGLPVVFSKRKGIVTVAFFAGLIGFVLLLFPMSRPDLYNDSTENCKCWHGYCSWN